MPTYPRNIIGPQLRRLRYERGLSQPELAAECQRMGWDISRDIIARIEGQTRWVADFELLLLARAFKVSVEVFWPTSEQMDQDIEIFLSH